MLLVGQGDLGAGLQGGVAQRGVGGAGSLGEFLARVLEGTGAVLRAAKAAVRVSASTLATRSSASVWASRRLDMEATRVAISSRLSRSSASGRSRRSSGMGLALP